VITGGADLRPGDTLVIPAAFGGWNVLGHVPDVAEPPADADRPLREALAARADVAERAYRAAGHRAALRVHPRLMSGWPEGPALDDLRGLACDSDDPTGEEDAIRDTLARLAATDGCPGWLAHLAQTLADRRCRLRIELHPDHPLKDPTDPGPVRIGRKDGTGGLVLLGTRRLTPENPASAHDSATSEDDTASIAPRPVAIDRHSRAVARQVDHFAKVFGLAGPLRSALSLAALWHDLGKTDRRFQAWP
jgi:CRISPR-associated endonuclease/helicase Cas3